VAVLTALALVKPMFETYDFLMDRFVDVKVKDFLESHIIISSLTSPNGRPQKAHAKSISEIASSTHLSEKTVRGCLNRLRKKRFVTIEQGDLWKSDIPPFCF